MSVTLYWIPGQSSNAQSAINFVSGRDQSVSIMPWGVNTATQSFESTVTALAPHADEIWVRMPTNAMKLGNPFAGPGMANIKDVIEGWDNTVGSSGKKLTGILLAHEESYFPYTGGLQTYSITAKLSQDKVAADIKAKVPGYKVAIIGGGTGAPNCDLYFVENYEPSCEGRIHPGVYAYTTTHAFVIPPPAAVLVSRLAMAAKPDGKHSYASFMCPGCACTGNSYAGTCEQGGTPTPFPTSLGSTHTGHHKRHDHTKWSPLHFDATSPPTPASLSGQALAAYHEWYPTCTSGSCQLIPTLGVSVTGSNADCLINPDDVQEAINVYKAAGGTALGLYA